MYYYDKMVQSKGAMLDQFLQVSNNTNSNIIRAADPEARSNDQTASFGLIQTKFDMSHAAVNIGNLNSKMIPKVRQMIDKYTDLIVTEISSVSFDDINSKIQLPNDICKLICEYTGHECAIMHLLYLIRREYYWKYKICHIIFLR